MNVPYFQHIFNVSEVIGSVLRLREYLFPNISRDTGDVEITALTQGTTNGPQKLYMVAVRPSGPAAIPRSESSLVKIYGDDTDIIIDRPRK
ncbi:hypothetical protein CCHR01_01734 [Colletotrichum chrysophilum]|uniref:Uncharacterized protein n=1 Tax=Colletotrichum chrysophilum TaxID=1836956 RepID=A0AAD9B1D2_9PEZI|nr:hypothetical protein CCHR01_01734 [Colletotrichum chrysophilum]